MMLYHIDGILLLPPPRHRSIAQYLAQHMRMRDMRVDFLFAKYLSREYCSALREESVKIQHEIKH